MSSQHNNTTAELRLIGYDIYHFTRDDKQGGGVSLIFRKNFKVKSAKTYSFESFECILVSISRTSASPLNFVVIYRFCELAPSLFNSEFYTFLDSIYVDFKNLIILGDFNLHVNDTHNQSILQFNDTLSTFGLSQLVESPTHTLGNTLDLVVVNTTEVKIKDLTIDFNNKSDHAYVFFNISSMFSTTTTKSITVNNYKNVDLQRFKSDLSSKVDNYVSNVDTTIFADALNEFNNLCETCVNDHVESKIVNINVNSRPKWMDSEFIKSRAERRRLYKRWKRTKDETDRENFVNSRANTHALATKKRSMFYASSIEKCNNSHKELFSVCKSLLDQTKSSVLPTYTVPENMAAKFNCYFIEKIEKIRRSFPDQNIDISASADVYDGPIMSEFQLVSPADIKKILSAKPLKTCPQDPIPATLFKDCVDELLPALTMLVNLSLSTGSMDGLKDSVITPILKKAGLDPEVLKNYRPVCNTLFLSKLIERASLGQANGHLDMINAHIPNQSGYKPKHSCETLLLKVSNDILVNFDEGMCTIELLLDLSAAFDTVIHELLLNILWSELGFRGTVYKWFENFLGNRRQSVGIDGHKSQFKETHYGVPQGSVVGPFLFNIYVRNLIKVMEEAGFTCHGYADDHQFWFKFQINFQVATIRRTIPQGLDLISSWMTKHFLKLNPTKSQVIVFCPKACSDQLVFDNLMLSDGSYIKLSSKVYNLGVNMDSSLTFSPHITTTVSEGYNLIRNLAGIRKYISQDHLKTLVNAIVIAKADNCNSLYYGISAYDSRKLQMFQNSCARLIYGKKKFEHVSGILRELHWLPSEARTYFKILCYVFKCLHGLAPTYLMDLIVIRRQHNLTLTVPRSNSQYGDRAFSRAGPRLWNALPLELRLVDSLESFKSQLKHILFSSFTQFKNKVNIYRS